MKKIFFIVLLSSASVYAQESNDSVKKKVAKEITDKFPSTRFLDVQYEQFTPTDYTSELENTDLEEGTIQNQKRIKVALNVPIIKKKKYVISGSLRYKFDSFEFSDVENKLDPENSLFHDGQEDFHYFSTALNFTYFSKLFGKTFIYNGSITADGSDKGYERINAVLIGSLVLKRTEQTTITAGLLAQTKRTSIFPVLPVFSYEHKFQSSPWTLDVVLPKHAYFRRTLFGRDRLSLGLNFDGEVVFAYPNQPRFHDDYTYKRNEIKTGFIYEYKLSNKIFATFQGGVSTIFSGQLREINKVDEIITTTQNINGYFNVGISFNPF
ncbi:DUF6268 family outer membrane beta-barrel protein [Sinomicrobium kalidii]|uniref:DUF6268 family outer membrane beta-barrel protein n=1 Tax=Sinomicrobium kalidii TaxID=2900738 RepID=UPI001E2C8432|nr:DUF6268 family outer membrane beta-barrel protein [Sinomicrobium kalidii]UGU15452.1 DUF6268 family outer membrane beta-barrel protein [Sinomicrobium kalidii]